MAILHFTVDSLDEPRDVVGRVEHGDPVVITTNHENKPDYELESDGTVNLLSANSEVRLVGFGRDGEIQAYCMQHGVDLQRLSGYDECPYCTEERRVEEMEQEMHERRADPQMHPSVDAPRW